MSNEDMIAVIEKLTGTEQLSSTTTEGDPVFLPNDILPSAALPTNTEDGYLLYSVPEGTDVVAPTRISSTVLFREPGGQ
ncbi:hypothetical protein, partial [Rhodococcus qingshengii]|uniref:hypothetical protein n=1 Tax=Rhodococcus qingshengii TaxID=334542 RepID=UPI001BE65D47